MRYSSERARNCRPILLLAAALTVHQGWAQEKSLVEKGTLRLHYLRLPIGYERYELTHESGALLLTSDFDFTDRGGRVRLASSLRMGQDLTPQRFRAQGKTYRFVRVDEEVEVVGRRATVREGARSHEVPLPDRFFTASGYAPFAVQMLLVRYWKAHGRPSVLPIAPGSPLTEVAVEFRGYDTVTLRTGSVRLERFSISGLAWGRESLWLDSSDQIAAVATWACGLAFEAIREEYEPALDRLLSKAVEEQMEQLGALSSPFASTQAGTVALLGATLVDGTTRGPVPDSAVIVEGDRITAAGPRRTVTIPTGARVVDATGRTLLPGLWDMHTHVAHAEWGLVYLGAGVTTIRDMGGEFEFITALRDALASGRGLGPRLLLAGLVDGRGPDAFGIVSAETRKEALEVVARYHAAGFQQIKVYDLVKPEVLVALATEAHRQGMSVTGHVPKALTIPEAVTAGMDQIAHLPIRGEAGSPETEALIQFLRAHHVVMDPVLSWNELLGRSSATPIESFQPGILKVPRAISALFVDSGDEAVDPATARTHLERSMRILGALHRAGVPIVAGTDEGVPGHSLHREIELYVEAGFTPLEAIQAATVVPAQAMGMDREVGTIEPGKRADLILVEGNPLEDIKNIRRVRTVMSQGRLYDCASLWKAVGFAE